MQNNTLPYLIMINVWKKLLLQNADQNKIETFKKFFKTDRGEYGEGDIFIGLPVPVNRSISKNFYEADQKTICEMLMDETHEFRLAALLALVEKYRRTKSKEEKSAIARYYITICHLANNWDLVDLSAPYILGCELDSGRYVDEARRLCQSPCLWHRRVAVVATLTPVRNGNTDLAYEMCHQLITDSHPLIQKAVGWVLRECGKKDIALLQTFLIDHIKQISSTTLSYATEKYDPSVRKYLRSLRSQT